MRPAVRTLHIIVACAERKRRAGEAPVRLRDVRAATLEERCAAWWKALSGASTSAPARDLYAGDHWSIARALPEVARRHGFSPSLWVASAGYGLVPEDAMLAPYSATFAPRSPDSIVDGPGARTNAATAWWRDLTARPLPHRQSPRTLQALAEASPPKTAMLVVASPAYLRALEDDLRGALALDGKRPSLVLVAGAPGPTHPALRPYWVQTAADLRMRLGGALTSLHARVARDLLEQIPPADFEAATAQAHVAELWAQSDKAPVYDRDRGDDDDIRAYIRKALKRDSMVTHTRLLRELRSSGRACEQGRFRRLFKDEASKS